jgi:ribosomal protein bL25 (Ctc-form)
MAQEELIMKAENRTVKGKQVKALRRAGYLPGVIYGRHLEAFPIQMNAHEVSLKLSKLSSSSLITIDVEGTPHAVIVRDRQRDPIYGRLIHVDFLAVSLTETLRTTVAISLVGEAPVSKLADVSSSTIFMSWKLNVCRKTSLRRLKWTSAVWRALTTALQLPTLNSATRSRS